LSRVGLFDTDIFAFKAAATNETKTEFGTYSYPEQARKNFDSRISEIAEKLELTKVIMCLTDDENFRYDVLPSYKSNRDRNKEARPELLSMLKDYAAEKYTSYKREGLEADDVMGILATHPTLIEGEKIIISEDKDMRTVSAKVYNPGKPEHGIMDISVEEAAAFHMWQTICGDSTDGYKGAVGIGKASEYAQDIIFTDMSGMWGEVLMAYAQVRLDEEAALVQARVAKILTAPYYDFKNKSVKLWSPINLIDGNGVY
jgi:5'-3' exonuclease